MIGQSHRKPASFAWIFCLVCLLVSTFAATPVWAACPDPFECNDTVAGLCSVGGQAVAPSIWQLANNSYASYICSADDVDWWSIDGVRQGQTLAVSLWGLPKDYDLALVRPDGTRLTSDLAGKADETIYTTAKQAGTWYARVSGTANKNFDPQAPYSLFSTTSDCRLDASEFDGYSQKAFRIPDLALSYATQDHNLCPASDQDWFARRVTERGTLRATLNQPHRGLGVFGARACIVARDGTTVLGCTKNLAETEEVQVAVDQPGLYFVRVDAVEYRSPVTKSSYNLVVDFWTGCAIDDLEINNSSSSAYYVADSQLSFRKKLSLCPRGDEDWLLRRLSPGDSAEATIEYKRKPGEFALVLELLAADGSTVLDKTSGSVDKETLSFSQSGGLAEDFFLRVHATNYQAPADPTYEFSLVTTPRFPGCNDLHEPNDLPKLESRLRLNSGDKVQSFLCTDRDRDSWWIEAKQGETLLFTVRHPDPDLAAVDVAALRFHDKRLSDFVSRGWTSQLQSPGIRRYFYEVEEDGAYAVTLLPTGGASGPGAVKSIASSKEPYELAVEKYRCSDRFQPNSEKALAARVFDNQRIFARVCVPGEVDYFRVRVNTGQRVEVRLDAAFREARKPDFEVVLYNALGSQVDLGDRRVSHTSEVTGDYFFEVRSKSGRQWSDKRPYYAWLLLGADPKFPARSLAIRGVEVTQAIQNLGHSVPLVVGKRAVARVYVDSGRSTTPEVAGYLEAWRNGKQLLPKRLKSTTTVATVAPFSLFAARSRFNLSLNFDLPSSWLSKSGKLEIRAHVFSPGFDDANPKNNRQSIHVEVKGVPVTHLRAVQVRDGCGGSCKASDGASFRDYRHLPGLARRMLPAPQIRLRPHTASVEWKDTESLFTSLLRISHLGVVGNELIFGVVRKRVNTWDPKLKLYLYGAALPYGPVWAQIRDGDQATLAHELGHAFCSDHVAGCGSLSPFETLPHNSQWLSGGGERDAFGLDLGSSPPRVLDPKSHSDVMNYCKDQWISPTTYGRLLRGMVAGACPRPRPKAPYGGPPGLLWLVDGTYFPEREEIVLLPLLEIDSATLSSSARFSPEGPFLATFLDEVGQPLAEHSFEAESSNYERSTGQPFSFAMPIHPRARRLVIERSGDLLYDLEWSPAPPEVWFEAVEPSGDDLLNVFWGAEDPDGEELTATLLISTDGGESWTAAADGVTGREIELDTTHWAGTEQGLLRLLVSDGTRTGQATSEPFAIEAKVPLVTLDGPQPGEEFVEGEPIRLVAQAFDAEDGFLEGGAIRWESAEHGFLGDGEELWIPSLGVGEHHLQVTATDRDDNSTTEEVTIFVRPPA